ncbi:pectate lyase [Catellatospora sichuanensis]|uniref:pectate lyase n=1 Tax=Catellatospora sichuanensis TaxID=1969805 RepID=UPI001FE46B3C|nr:pectate lyase [Catellatospora sichuanensis]
MATRTLPRPRPRTWSLIAGLVLALTTGAIALSQNAFAATVFSDTFEDGAADGWSKSGGTWTVVTDGTKALQQSNTSTDNARQFAGSTSWTAYTVTARVKPLSFGSNGHVSLLARSTGATVYYRLSLRPGNSVQLQAVNGSTVTVLGSATRTVATGTWYTLGIEANGSTIRGLVDGTVIASATSTAIANGRIGLQTAYSSASFDDIAVNTGGTPAPTTPAPSATTSPRPSASPSAPASPTASPTVSPPPTGWPTPSGNAPVSNGTIPVSGVFDGGMKRYCCIGDGGQGEAQDPVFELAAGATIKNVILGAPAGDGIHCLGNCTIENVWWEDVGEDAATFLGGTNYYVIGGGARAASDKIFQHNGPGTLHISGFYAENFGKLYRACGNCSSSYQRHVVIDNVRVKSGDVIAGININWGDTARFTRITVIGDSDHETVICDKFNGVPKGSEPTHVGSGADGVNCIYNAGDISWQ